MWHGLSTLDNAKQTDVVQWICIPQLRKIQGGDEQQSTLQHHSATHAFIASSTGSGKKLVLNCRTARQGYSEYPWQWSWIGHGNLFQPASKNNLLACGHIFRPLHLPCQSAAKRRLPHPAFQSRSKYVGSSVRRLEAADIHTPEISSPEQRLTKGRDKYEQNSDYGSRSHRRCSESSSCIIQNATRPAFVTTDSDRILYLVNGIPSFGGNTQIGTVLTFYKFGQYRYNLIGTG